MNRKIATRFDRVKYYLERIRQSMQKNDPVQAMADAAELVFQAQMLYAEFVEICNTRKTDGNKC